jgi:FeS assembly protein IscX
MKFSWTEMDDIAIGLYENHPEEDPLKVRFTQLLDWVLELDGFTGTREESNENKLEAIQMAWLEEWKDNQD